MLFPHFSSEAIFLWNVRCLDNSRRSFDSCVLVASFFFCKNRNSIEVDERDGWVFRFNDVLHDDDRV